MLNRFRAYLSAAPRIPRLNTCPGAVAWARAWAWSFTSIPFVFSLVVFSLPASAQDGPRLYDVEVLVFRHLGPNTLSPQAVTDYTGLPLPLLHPSEDPTQEQKPSPGMETAWRKLRNSGAQEPLWYRRWRQATSNYNRPRRYRIHNDEPLQRPQLSEHFPGALFAPEQPAAITPETASPALPLEPVEVDLKTAFRTPFPATEKDPENYRLDGWLSFSRQRFYHIGLALELRSVDAWGDSGDTLRSDDRIAQSRRIEIGRFEYFDSPGLSALVRVTEVTKPDFSPDFSGSDAEGQDFNEPDAGFDLRDNDEPLNGETEEDSISLSDGEEIVD